MNKWLKIASSEKAISIGEAAALMGESIESTKHLVYGGFLRGFLTNEGKWLVDVRGVEKWLQSGS